MVGAVRASLAHHSLSLRMHTVAASSILVELARRRAAALLWKLDKRSNRSCTQKGEMESKCRTIT